MDLKQLFYTLFRSFNTHSYPELTDRKFGSVLKYFLFVTILSIILMFILFIPSIFYFPQAVANDVSHFQNLDVGSTFTLKDSFNLLSNPVIRMDSTQQNLTDELVLITPDTISYKQYILFGRQVDMPMVKNVDVANSSHAKALIGIGLIFLIPSLFFWSIILFIIYFAVIILLTFILGLIVTGLFRVGVGIGKIFKTAIYSSTAFIIMQLVLMPFFRIFWIPLLVYWLLFFIVLFSWREKLSGKGTDSKGNFGQSSGSSKTREIFGRKENSGSFAQKHVEVRDSYDVDENGNMKGSGAALGISKKHSKSNDDDGYVEL